MNNEEIVKIIQIQKPNSRHPAKEMEGLMEVSGKLTVLETTWKEIKEKNRKEK